MPIESAADRASFLDPSEFGIAVLWEGAQDPIPALHQNGTLLLAGLDGPDTQVREASIVVAEASLPLDADQGDSVSVASMEFVVRSIEPDGTGMALVRLERDDG